MPDLSMCKNGLCPSRNKCYRFKAKPSEYFQSYSEFKFKEGESKCKFFILNFENQ
jgi:hypothetical protein